MSFMSIVLIHLLGSSENYQDKIANARKYKDISTLREARIDLARAIKDRLNESYADVILLTNGLVAGADSPEKASELLKKFLISYLL